MPLAQIEVEVAGTRAEVGAWLGHEGEGALHPAGVARTFPDPFLPAVVAPPHTFSFPDQRWCAAPPLGCVRTRAPSPSAPGFARCSTHPSWGCAASPPRSPLGERWGFVGADGGTRLHTRAPAPSAGTWVRWGSPRTRHMCRGEHCPSCPGLRKVEGWGMRTPFLSHRTPFARGWEPNGVRALCMAARPYITPAGKRVCEHDPVRRPTCTTPARPTFRTPPCTRRPACGTAPAWHPKGGCAGVMHAERHAGSCSHTMGEGCRFPSAPLLLVSPSCRARPH